jgi:hypothetical protein
MLVPHKDGTESIADSSSDAKKLIVWLFINEKREKQHS